MSLPHDYLERVADALEISPETVNQRMLRYRSVFSGEDGLWVLSDLLTTLGYFDTGIKSEGGMALHNFATGHLLFWLGIWHEQNKEAITRALLTIPMAKEEGSTQNDHKE